MKKWGIRLKSARISAGYEEAQEFAEALGVEPGRYRRYERGETFPTLGLLADIKRLTGKSLDWLILGETDTAPPRLSQHSTRR